MVQIPGETFPAPKGGRRSAGVRSREHRRNQIKAGEANDGPKGWCISRVFGYF